MAFSTTKTLGALFGAACIAATAAPASAGPMSVAPLKDVSLASPVTDVAYRSRNVRSARHVKVRRHYVGHRRYYVRRHNNGFPVAALGLFAGALGAAAYSSSYDDCYYGGCGGYYPSYSYGYGYPAYSYGYAQPRYYGGGRRFVHRGYGGPRFGGGQHFGGPRVAGFRGGMGARPGGGMMRVGGGGGRMGGGGGGRHR
ncbi:MAG: hypothetical protein JWN07_2356 [Hyphomicrobiales bacterium]|nr:hypothetical protein [Hyphomicrobiales bacterium]